MFGDLVSVMHVDGPWGRGPGGLFMIPALAPILHVFSSSSREVIAGVPSLHTVIYHSHSSRLRYLWTRGPLHL